MVERKKRNIKQSLLLLLFGIVLSSRYYEGVVNCLNTTVYAFSYKYGYISRAFMGTLIRVINKLFAPVLPYDLLTYDGMVLFAGVLNTIFIIMLVILFYMCLNKCEQRMETRMLALMFVLSVFAFPEYLTVQNFGRSDICMAMITIFGCYLLLNEKFEWLIIPLSGVAVSIHQGYVLMFFNVLLVILWCKIFDNTGKKRNKYILIFLFSFILASVLFIYLNFFSHGNGKEIYDEIYVVASSLAYDGVVHLGLMWHEILGESPFEAEWVEHVHNFCEFPIFLVLVSPYLVIAFRFFKETIKEAKGLYKLKYLAIAVGSATILPDLIVKIDYGRWMFSIVFYYFVTILVLLASGDKIIVSKFNEEVNRMKNKPALMIGLLMYPLLFTPLRDVYICDLTNDITNYILELSSNIF